MKNNNQNRNKKTIIFDWGGVVAADPGDDFLFNIMLQAGATPQQAQQILHRYIKPFMVGNLSELEFWQLLRSEFNLRIPDSISEEFMKWSGLKAEPEILALIEEARSNGWQIGLLTNVIQPTYNVLKSAGYYDLFDSVIASCIEGMAKPDRHIYDLALQRLKTAADKSIFIDDKQSNLDPAQELGFTTILATETTQVVKDVQLLLKSK